MTQESFRDFPLSTARDPAILAHDLEFLVGYYEARSNQLAGSHLERLVRQQFEQTITNVLIVFRRETTNDLGGYPRAWIAKYGK